MLLAKRTGGIKLADAGVYAAVPCHALASSFLSLARVFLHPPGIRNKSGKAFCTFMCQNGKCQMSSSCRRVIGSLSCAQQPPDFCEAVSVLSLSRLHEVEEETKDGLKVGTGNMSPV